MINRHRKESANIRTRPEKEGIDMSKNKDTLSRLQHYSRKMQLQTGEKENRRTLKHLQNYADRIRTAKRMKVKKRIIFE